MRGNQEARRRLHVRRETMRRLSALGDRQLAQVVGGTDTTGGFDPTTTPYSAECWTEIESYSAGSRYC